jgi:iron complex outermembrane receptor protein
MRTLLLVGCAIGTMAVALEAHAQTVTPATTTAGPTSLSEVVVTAQHRSENLQNAALAVSAVSGNALVAAGVTRPSDLTSIVPALQVAPAAGPISLFYLRGVGNFNGNSLSDPAIAFNFDGVYIGRPSSTTGFFYDIDRVEVLKGPQGTLYGRNATGGAINVISQKPVLGRYAADLSAEYGNYNAVGLDGAVNLPVGENAAVRAAVSYVRHDGYMKDGTDDQNDLAGRLSFRWEPTDTLSINVVADYLSQRGEGTGGDIVQSGINNRYGLLSPQGQAYYSSQPNLLLGRNFAPLTTQPFMRNDSGGISSTIDWRTPIGTLTLIPAYRQSDLNYMSVAPGFYLWERETDRQGSLEARLASSDEHPLRYQLGAFYYNESDDDPYYYVNQQANVNNDYYKQTDENEAVFGRLTYAVTNDFRLNVGARYTNETKGLAGALTGDIRPCVFSSCPDASPLPLTLALAQPNSNPFAGAGTLTLPLLVDRTGANALHASFDKLTYRAGADWNVTSHNLLYASYETGFKSGGFFFTADNGVYQPETIQAYTLGSKNRFLDNRLQINAELFYWLYDNQQISHLVADSTGAVILATQNVGHASYKGIEVETRYRATSTTELTADIQYLDARYSSFVYQTPNQNGGVSNGTSCPSVGAATTTYTIDCSGNTPPYAPEWTINLGGEQTVHIGEGRLVGDLRAHWQSLTLTGLEFLPSEYQSAYWQVDTQIAYTPPGDRYTVALFCNNLFDATVIGNTFPTPFSLMTAATLRPPRTFGARVSAKF